MKIKRLKGIQKYLGLMFKSREVLPVLFEFKEDRLINIHSWFVYFPFRALWLDENNKVLDEKIVFPFTTYNPEQMARKLLEIPL